MVFNKQRDCHVIRKLEAKLDIHSFTRQKFCPISCRRYPVGKENKDHTIPRVLRRRRKHTGGKPAHQGAKGESVRTIARTDCKLMPNHLSQYHSEKFYIYWPNLANNQITLWIPDNGGPFHRLWLYSFRPERPEDLFQRLTAFVEDNLLRKNMGITHHNETIEEDEELCPSLENVIVFTWLKLLHPGLPKLVKQRYGMELRARTLASIKPEISQALESLLEELRTSEDAKPMRILTNRFHTCKTHQDPRWNRALYVKQQTVPTGTTLANALSYHHKTAIL